MLNIIRKSLPLILPLFILSMAGAAQAAEFGQADLETIVKELDKVIPENTHYKYPIKCSIVDKDELNAYATKIGRAHV